MTKLFLLRDTGSTCATSVLNLRSQLGNPSNLVLYLSFPSSLDLNAKIKMIPISKNSLCDLHSQLIIKFSRDVTLVYEKSSAID